MIRLTIANTYIRNYTKYSFYTQINTHVIDFDKLFH